MGTLFLIMLIMPFLVAYFVHWIAGIVIAIPNSVVLYVILDRLLQNHEREVMKEIATRHRQERLREERQERLDKIRHGYASVIPPSSD